MSFISRSRAASDIFSGRARQLHRLLRHSAEDLLHSAVKGSAPGASSHDIEIDRPDLITKSVEARLNRLTNACSAK